MTGRKDDTVSTPGRDDVDDWDEDDAFTDDDAPDVLSDDAGEGEILSPDPDEYSDEPHMGSVPRLLGEEEYMPDTQGEDPIYAELGDEGQGDLAPEDL
jgi:hypothetical protein